jgi:hypothetical protein
MSKRSMAIEEHAMGIEEHAMGWIAKVDKLRYTILNKS